LHKVNLLTIIAATNANSRQSQLDNVKLWSQANSMKVNPAKYVNCFYAYTDLDRQRHIVLDLSIDLFVHTLSIL